MPATYHYHWTHRANLASILATGLDPSRARGKMRVVWMCEASRVMWAVAHVSRHHEIDPDDMVLLRIRSDRIATRPTSWPLVRVSDRVVSPRRICGVRTPLGTRWVSLARAAR